MEKRERPIPEQLGTTERATRLPMITFRLSEDEGNTPFMQDLSTAQTELESIWRAVEPQVLSSFE